jgi:chemotaxis protein histidine kinase CheA
MNIGSITTPKITDFDLLEEFAELLHDAVPGIERNVSNLRQAPGNSIIIADLFRILHSVKGDAGLCKIELAVVIVHPIETVLGRVRDGEITFGDILAEAILLAIDRLELAMENLCTRRPLDNLRLPALLQGLEKLAGASSDDVEMAAGELIEAVTDFRPAARPRVNIANDPADDSIEPSPIRQINDTLLFFRSLAEQLESRSAQFKGRTTRLLRLAAETNHIRDNPVDPIQLEAAIYMHDIGMMFLPESVWLKSGQMTPEERAMLRNHPSYAAGLLSRMQGWETAAEMVAQHHEMPDGGGYPQGLAAQTICDGAKILSIVDAFESVMLKHANRGRNRSVLRAIAEINACDNQFAPEWIGPFNQLIHRTIEQ